MDELSEDDEGGGEEEEEVDDRLVLLGAASELAVAVHPTVRALHDPARTGLDKLDRLPEDLTVHLDRGYDSRATRALLAELGFDGAIARKGIPAPVQAGSRWVVERTHQWMNGYGKLRRCTEKLRPIVDFYLFLAAALVVLRQLIHRARLRYRWPSRPTTRRLK